MAAVARRLFLAHSRPSRTKIQKLAPNGREEGSRPINAQLSSLGCRVRDVGIGRVKVTMAGACNSTRGGNFTSVRAHLCDDILFLSLSFIIMGCTYLPRNRKNKNFRVKFRSFFCGSRSLEAGLFFFPRKGRLAWVFKCTLQHEKPRVFQHGDDASRLEK